MFLALTILSWGVLAPPAEAVTYQVDANGYYIPDYFETANWANSPALTKFTDTLPLLCGPADAGKNNLGQCIPVAEPDITTYPGSDYYEIELVEYRERMHTSFPALNNADKRLATTGGTKIRGYRQINTTNPDLLTPHYAGPAIIATRYDPNYAPGAALPTGGVNGKPVRIKFINSLPTGTAGNLFIPVDTTIMGSGPYTINYDPATKAPIAQISGTFPQNRAVIHLHGGRTPWISDGTPHQWTVPAAEDQTYGKGVSVSYVPDMWFDASGNTITACAGQTTCATPGATNNPGPGKETYYYTNEQSARLLFFHGHAWGITRQNVYIGMAAPYVIRDYMELALRDGGTIRNRGYSTGTIPSDEIPLVIQDKTFVDATGTTGTNPNHIMNTDPTWAWGSNPGKPVTATPVTGDLWWPHVYMPAQNPYNPNLSGINDMGRWHYGPWFFPSTPTCGSTPDAVKPFCIEYGPVANPYANGTTQPPEMPGTPNPSWGAEAFLDTMVVNGTAYPKLTVDHKAYRLRILNASHDRFLNLQLYKASPIIQSLNLNNGGSGYTSAPTVTISGDGTGATATATVAGGVVTGLTLDTVGSGYTTATVGFSGGGGTGAAATATVYTALTEVGMVPSALTSGFPDTWPADGREGGVPDPAKKGPAFIQIGNDGGFLPAPVVLPNQPVSYNVDPTMFNWGNVLQQNQGGGTLFLGPAERADVIVDFSNYGGQTLILYNDAPTAFPALDPHYDYYTGAPDRTDIGGYQAIPPGVGPNIRTVMQIVVNAGGSGTAPPDDYNPTALGTLQTAFASDATTPGVFAGSQDPIVVGQAAYGTGTGNTSAYYRAFPATWPYWGISRISDGAISFQRVDGTPVNNYVMTPKAIHDEMGATFDDYGRMSAKLGLELPFTNAAIANFILQNFVDPATEKVKPNQVQIWRITHNGVDTHPIHFHLFDVQVLNRVGWDGFIRLPDPNELGWKDTVRMSPLEDTIVALRPILPVVPFELHNSIRPLNPAAPYGSTWGFSQVDTTTGGNLAIPTTNQLTNFGHEYVWHCHILSHEENDMMRSVTFNTDSLLFATYAGAGLWQWDLGTWTQINNTIPANMVAAGANLYATFAGQGLFRWDGNTWSQLNAADPTSMLASGTNLYATFSGFGLAKWDGSQWSRLNTAIPTSMVASGTNLYAVFSGFGLAKWDGTVWSQLNTAEPTSMVASGTSLYATFAGYGLVKWDGTAWSQLNTATPTRMVASGTNLYAAFAGFGLAKWDGTSWSQLNRSVPTEMVVSGSSLYAAFPGFGLAKWDGTTWSQLNTTVPASMIASGSILYSDFTGFGLTKWEANGWSLLRAESPQNMVSGF